MMKHLTYDIGGEVGKIVSKASDCWKEEIEDNHVQARNDKRRERSRMEEAQMFRVTTMYR
jgi:hypothetical protein